MLVVSALFFFNLPVMREDFRVVRLVRHNRSWDLIGSVIVRVVTFKRIVVQKAGNSYPIRIKWAVFV